MIHLVAALQTDPPPYDALVDEAPPTMEPGYKLRCDSDCGYGYEGIVLLGVVLVFFVVAAWSLFGRGRFRRRRKP